ncbi:MAG TPA: bi-domain-containing oxidoreductase [Steroidobacteraceae bacterium]|jgi:predicted dehydrogenase/threonine dehydrogenase-like Zn-dependent dehydrogenase|nr:bi-domain-containing oxidoreductase [Steroidobacteraceae bacterium]
MRQVLQSLADGRTILAEVPASAVTRGGLLVRTTHSLISAGTERMLVEFGRAGWLEKARQQPEKVRQVLDKVRTDGFAPTLAAVRGKLDQMMPLGYCNVGRVVEIGADVRGFAVGDRVVSNGPHAELVAVARNLCARIPDGVLDDEAVFTVLGAIALQGVRLAAPTLGERFVVIGLGLLGLLTVQLLRANGCRVLGIDPDTARAEVARRFGADVVLLERGEDPLSVADEFSGGLGVDGVLITASTRSSDPVSQGARMCRQRGRIVLVGVSGLELNRSDFYQKELSFQVSCSYGPGRYDPQYEELGTDYPLGFVRWTEQRNFQAVLEMMNSRAIDVRALITHRFGLDAAPAAYELLATQGEPHLGILLEYATQTAGAVAARTVICDQQKTHAATGAEPAIAVIGAGSYAARVLIPAFAASGVRLRGIASGGGVTAAQYARKFGFARATTDSEALIGAEDIDIVVIATRHNSHARFVRHALQAGKHVFVEKPLALTAEEIDSIAGAWSACAPSGQRPQVMVGFNRRFAPQVVRMKALLAGVRATKSFVVTVNAGAIPAAHWTRDPHVGGGRIIGECCHFVDLLRFLAGQAIVQARVQAFVSESATALRDTVAITLGFADGSWGTIHYLTNGHASFPKERIEVFCAGRILQLDNFRRLRAYGWPGFSAMRLWRQDKGHRACARAFVDAVRSGTGAPIPFEELLEVARVTLALSEAARD